MKHAIVTLILGLFAMTATAASAYDARAAERHARQAGRAAGVVENQLRHKLDRGHFMVAQAQLVEALADALKVDFDKAKPLQVVKPKYRAMVQHAQGLMSFLAHSDIDRDRRLQNQARLMYDDIVTIGQLIGVNPDRVVIDDVGGRG